MIDRIFKNAILHTLTYLVRRNRKWIVFGSWMGKHYIDNPRYLYEYLLEGENDYKLIWVGDIAIKNEVRQGKGSVFAKKNSIKAIYYLLKSKYIFISQTAGLDLTPLSLYRKATIVQCWHGVPVKNIMPSADEKKNDGKKEKLRKIVRRFAGISIQYSYFVSASPKNNAIFKQAFGDIGATDENMLHSGYPRNDMLINFEQTQIEQLKRKYSRLLGFDVSKRIILYLPTYRRKENLLESLCVRNKKETLLLNNLLNKYNAILIEKNHFRTYERMSKRGDITEGDLMIKIETNHRVNIQELLLITDILISDYSGAFLDFLLLDRPIIHYAYDYYFYKNEDQGLCYDIKEFAAGKVADNFDGLIEELEALLKGNDKYRNKRLQVKNDFMTYEMGHACEYICERVLN